MKLNIYRLSVIFFVLLAIHSCNSIHVFPDTENPAVMISVDLKLSCKAQPLIEETTKAIGNDQTLRAVIEVYKADNMDKIVDKKEIITNIIDPSALNIVENFILPDGKYRFLVWMDYVSNTDKKDQYYKTKSTLRTLGFIEPLVSNTDDRDCFYGSANTDLTTYRSVENKHIEVPMELIRPVAKYMLIATDVSDFITKSKTKGETKTEFDISKFTVKVYPQGFTPNSFDVHSGQPNDAKTGLMYTATVKLLNSEEAIMCFDYPLVDGQSSSAHIGIVIYDDKGVKVNEVSDIKIPITRNKLTVLRSTYLTNKHSPGVSINPEYDGEIDIIIPD